MGLYQKQGFKRLSGLIAFLGFVITYIITYSILLICEKYFEWWELFDIRLIFIPLLGAYCAFIITRAVYWVIDGFQIDKE